MQGVLDQYLHFYNMQRSHQSYRIRGRTPGEIFFARKGRREQQTRDQTANTQTVWDTPDGVDGI